MLHLLRSAWGLLAAFFMAFLIATPQAMAQGSPFNCDVVFYQVKSKAGASQVVKFASVSSTVTPTGVYAGTQTTVMNSMGYNAVDNYLYGISAVTGIPTLYRIGSSGYQAVGTISNSLAGGLALDATFVPTAGVFDAAGRYYFAGQNTNIVPPAIFRVDAIPLSGALQVAHQYNLTPTVVVNVGDFDFNGAGGPNGLLLAATGTNHYRMTLIANSANPAQGTASVQVVPLATGPNGNSVGAVGSAFYDAFAGRFYVFDNNASSFWEIQNPQVGTPTPILTLAPAYIGPSPFDTTTGVTPTDGTSCPISGNRVADLSISKTDGISSVPLGAVISYTISVANAGPYPANYSVVKDPAAPGLTKLSVTCSAPGGPPSAVCPATLSTTTFEAGVQLITFPPTTTLLFTVNAKVTGAVGTSITNTATVTPASDTSDPDLSNNVAIDVDLISATTTTVVSAASMCPAGSAESLTSLLSNGDFAAALPLASDATIGLQNTYNVANSVSRQLTTQFYLGGNGILQNQFPGDSTARSVPSAQNWLLSNGKTGAANYRVWSQPVTGLTVGRTYEFMSYVSNATRPGTTSPTLPDLRLQVSTGAVTSQVAAFSPVNETALGGDVWTLVQGTFSASVSAVTLSISNFAAASAEPGGGDVAALAQVTLRSCDPSADVSVAKTNGVSNLTSTGTTAYTITVSNISVGVNATNTLMVDPGVANLAKTTITCTVTAPNVCPASLSILGLEGAGLTIPLIVAGGTVVFKVSANVTGPPGSTATNVVTVSGVSYTDPNPANNQAQDSDPITGSANLSVSKDNGTSTVAAGGTTSYTLTVANAGPAQVTGAMLKDPVVPGLSCSAVTCTGTIGAASCPAAGSTTIAALQGAGGIVLPAMSNPSSVTFRVDCAVTATGF